MNRTRLLCLVATGFLVLAVTAVSEQPEAEQVNWARRIEKVKPGMKRQEVEKLFPQRYWGARQYGKDGMTETYWVDDQWAVTLFYEYDDIRDEKGKIIPNVGNNRLGKVLNLERREHPRAQIPKSEWTHARALQLVLDLRREEIKKLEDSLPDVFVRKLKWSVQHVPSYGGTVIRHRFIVEFQIGDKSKATWDVDLYAANVSRRTEEKKRKSNNRTDHDKQ